MRLPFRNIRDVLGLHAKVSAHKPCVVFYDSTETRWDLTYLEFVGKAHQVANFLYEDLDITRGDTIAIASQNHENSLLLFFAAWIIGASVVALDIDASDESLRHALEDSKSHLLFAQHTLCDRMSSIAGLVTDVEGLIQIGGDVHPDYLRFEDLAHNRPTTFLGDESGAKGADVPITGGNARTAGLNDCALITYRGQRAIHRSQGDLLTAALRFSQATALTGNQQAYAAQPFAGAFAESILAPIVMGATLVLEEAFAPDRFWHLLVKERIHVTVMAAEQIRQLVATGRSHLDNARMRFGGNIIQQDVKHFRHVVVIDPDLTTAHVRDFETIFGLPIMTGHRHPDTEALLTLLPITLAWSQHQEWLLAHSSPSIGVPLIELSIVDADGRPVMENQSGWLALRDDDHYQSTGLRAYFVHDTGGMPYFFLEN